MNFPKGAVVKNKTTYDGDTVIESITYKSNRGESQTVKFETSMDGDRVPKVARSIDGDYQYSKEIKSYDM